MRYRLNIMDCFFARSHTEVPISYTLTTKRKLLSLFSPVLFDVDDSLICSPLPFCLGIYRTLSVMSQTGTLSRSPLPSPPLPSPPLFALLPRFGYTFRCLVRFCQWERLSQSGTSEHLVAMDAFQVLRALIISSVQSGIFYDLPSGRSCPRLGLKHLCFVWGSTPFLPSGPYVHNWCVPVWDPHR